MLDGVRVLDFTRAVAGPHATRLLRDWGADVVKVEPPRGDATRRWGSQVHGLGPFFSQQNCGKRSVSVDLETSEGRQLCRDLAAVADVCVDNFRPGVMEGLGLGYEELARTNPRLICASITGYGREGERAGRRAFANVIHAETGILEREARRGGHEPIPIRWSAADTYASLELASGILAALYHRERTGDGQRVEVAMTDTMLSVDDFAAFDLWDAPAGPQPDPVLVPTADGHVMISANPVLSPQPFLEAMGRHDLLEEPRFATREARAENRGALIEEIAAWASRLPGDVVETLCDQTGLAAGKVRHTREAIELARGEPRPVIVDVDDRGGGTLPLINSPQRFSGAVGGIGGVVPYRGEHNTRVLADWLGLDAEAITRLESAGGVHPPDEG